VWFPKWDAPEHDFDYNEDETSKSNDTSDNVADYRIAGAPDFNNIPNDNATITGLRT